MLSILGVSVVLYFIKTLSGSVSISYFINIAAQNVKESVCLHYRWTALLSFSLNLPDNFRSSFLNCDGISSTISLLVLSSTTRGDLIKSEQNENTA